MSDHGPIDPGLQPERTRLAWSRTSLAFLANGGLMLHAGHDADWVWLLPGSAVIAVSGLVYAAGEARYRRVGAAVRENEPVTGSALVAATAAAALFAALMAVAAMLWLGADG
ncbi:MAG TPA: DUF202 domain-containing protein [Yinghuangia sp.]|uniref:DUF202 domain-containing protein n=1 Tax=Yinghuangia sp. YIM S10712 TaxID=3436930 RepID=UPI002C906781|nr:DUF202 domain-containing protein [Yinghuangia sp.]